MAINDGDVNVVPHYYDDEDDRLMDVDREHFDQDEDEGVESSSDSRDVSRVPLCVRLYWRVLSHSSALKALVDTCQKTEQYLNLFLNESKDVATALKCMATEIKQLKEKLDHVELITMSLASKKRQKMWPWASKLTCKSRSRGKKKKEAAEHHGESEDDDEHVQKKKAKRGATGISAGDDEIDEEEEVLYMQALDDQDQQPLPEQDESGPSGASLKKDQIEIETPSTSLERKRKLSVDEQEPANKKAMAATASSPAMSTGARSQAVKPSAPPSVANVSTPASPPATMAIAPPMAAQGKGEVEHVSRPNWPLCQAFLADDFASGEVGKPLATPTKYTKDVQKSKWAAEVMKIKPYVAMLERLLSSSGAKTTETELKNAIKALGKINGKMDKRLDYEAASATPEEPPLSTRASCLKELFEAVKALKDLSIMAGKTGSITSENLSLTIKKIQAAAHKLVPGVTIGFPLHWVQAWWG
eukprot:s1849_g7.t1